jgi:hypothetical protein
LSDEEDEDVQDEGSTRKRRGQIERQDTSELGELSVKGSETDPGVKDVTRGVKKVELEDKGERSSADEDEGTAEEGSELAEGESSVSPPLDPAQVPQTTDGSSQDATVVDNETPADQSETIAESCSNDPIKEEAPKSADVMESIIKSDNLKEEEKSDVAPVAEVVDSTDSVARRDSPS